MSAFHLRSTVIMPQGLATAPVDLAPKWPSGYIDALRDVGAQEKHIPFCIRWVRAFFSEYPGRRRRDLGRTEIEAFLRESAARPNVTNWQVQQARESLEVYYERFRGIGLAPRPDSVFSSSDDTPLPVRDPIESSRRNRDTRIAQHPAPPSTFIMRQSTPTKPQKSNLFRLSHRTEQTYVAWIRRFVEFHGWRKPSQLSPAETKAFLKHLALDLQVASSTQNQALNAIVLHAMAISFYNRKDHGWRGAYNPLRGLSLPKLVSLLEAGERGDFSDLQRLYYYMERSDAVIFSVLQRRRADGTGAAGGGACDGGCGAAALLPAEELAALAAKLAAGV